MDIFVFTHGPYVLSVKATEAEARAAAQKDTCETGTVEFKWNSDQYSPEREELSFKDPDTNRWTPCRRFVTKMTLGD